MNELLAHSDASIKKQAEDLLNGKPIVTRLEEQIDFNQLYTKKWAIWSLLLSTGYVKPLNVYTSTNEYKLELTNFEVQRILERKISEWFPELSLDEDDNFIQQFLTNNVDVMNTIMTEIVSRTFSYFDTRNTFKNDRSESESFYHGFILGLLITLRDRYSITSNRESGYGRYDLCLYPTRSSDPGIVIEFKAIDVDKEENLKKTSTNALRQIKERRYINDLIAHNVAPNNIYVYGFAFQGKKVLICGGAESEIDWKSIVISS